MTAAHHQLFITSKAFSVEMQLVWAAYLRESSGIILEFTNIGSVTIYIIWLYKQRSVKFSSGKQRILPQISNLSGTRCLLINVQPEMTRLKCTLWFKFPISVKNGQSWIYSYWWSLTFRLWWWIALKLIFSSSRRNSRTLFLILGNGQCFHKNVHVGSDLLRHLTSSVIDCIEIVTSDLSLD